jgi:hypothetical protein
MPRIKKNTLIKGASGNYQKEFVYKQRGGKTFIAGMPTVDKKRVKTVNSVKVTQRFLSARAYAEAAMADPVRKAFYAKKVQDGQTAFNVAFKDFQKKPSIFEIDTENYVGTIGSEVAVTAMDDCKVTDVAVRIVSPAGVLIEEGLAVFNAFNNARWIYTATQNNPALPGCKITATAKDLPGNKGSLDKTL